MKALVTGATGLLGNNLVRHLLNAGHEVRVLLRQASQRRPLEGLKVEPVVGDLSNSDEVESAVAGMDSVFHCAGYVKIGWQGLDEAREINVEGTRLLARATRNANARMLHVSSVNTLTSVSDPGQVVDESMPAEPPIKCAYVISKTEAEAVIHDEITKGLDAVIVHPSFMLGPFDWRPSSGKMVVEVIKKRPPFAPSGGCSLAHVQDVAEACTVAIAKAKCGEHYILGGENLTYLELWRKIARLKNRPGAFGCLGKVASQVVGRTGDLWARACGQETEVNSAAVRMGRYFHYYSSEKAQRDLGYRMTSSDETVRAAYDWFVDNGYLKP